MQMISSLWQQLGMTYRKRWWSGARLLVKGLKVNAGKTKMMVGGGGRVVSDLGAWPCEVDGRL